jgi:hypothetical protein
VEGIIVDRNKQFASNEKPRAAADIANLKYFRVTHGKIAGVPVDTSDIEAKYYLQPA